MGLFDRLKKKQQAETSASVPLCPELAAIAKYMDDKGIKYSLAANETFQWLSVIMADGNGKKETYLFNCSEKSGLYVLGYIPREIPGRSYDAVKELMNRLNREYRFINLSFDEKKRSIDAVYQLPKCVDNLGEVAIEILARMSNVFEEVMAEVNRVIQ